MKEEFPFKKETITAIQAAELLWLVSDKIFDTEDVQTSKEFLSHFYPASILVNSELKDERPAVFPQNILYQSCIFEKPVPIYKCK